MTTLAQILAAVHQATGCEPAEIVSKSRRHSVLFPRYIALLMLKRARPFHSNVEIGRALGLEGDGTARWALIKAREMLASDPDFIAAHSAASAILRQTTAPDQPLALQPQAF